MPAEPCPGDWMLREDSVRERYDGQGHRWLKVYSGGGQHFYSWLEQFREVYGEDNIEVEEVSSAGGPACFEREEEPVMRIWARASSIG